MNFTIYSVGDADFLFAVLNGVSMLTRTGDFADLIRLGFLFGIILAVLQGIQKGGSGFSLGPTILGFLLFSVLFVPKVDVNIEDTYTGSVTTLSNVPLGIGFSGNVVSLIGVNMTEAFETAYTTVVPYMSDSGFAESLQILSSVRRNAASNPAVWNGFDTELGGGDVDTKKTLYNYIKDCTLVKVELGIIEANDILTSNIFDVMKFNSALDHTETCLVSTGCTVKSCDDAWTEIEADLAPKITSDDDTVDIMVKSTLKDNVPGVTALSRMSTAQQALLGASTSAESLVMAGIIQPIISEAAAGKYVDLQDVNLAIQLNTAIQQRNTAWAAEQSLFMSAIRPMMAFFEAFVYAIFPIMAFVITLGEKGIALGMKYFQMLLTVQLWPPILAIIHLYITTAAVRDIAKSLPTSLSNESIYALNTAAQHAETWVATGGMLAASTPVLALMIVSGSSYAAAGLANRMSDAGNFNSKNITPDATSVGPLMNTQSMFTGDTRSGTAMQGGDTSRMLSLGSQASTNLSSAQAEQRTEQDQYGQQLSSTVGRVLTAGNSKSFAEDFYKSGEQSNSKVTQAANKAAKQMVEEGTITANEEKTAAVAMTLTAGLKGTASAGVGTDALAGGMLKGMGMEKINKIMNAGSNLMGSQGATGSGAGPTRNNVNASSDSGDSTSGSGDTGAGIKLAAHAAANGEMKMGDAVKTASQTSDKNSNSSEASFTEQDAAQLRRQFGEKFSGNHQASWKNDLSKDDREAMTQAHTELVASNQSVNEAESVAQTIGSTQSIDSANAAQLVNDNGGDKSVREWWKNQSPEMKEKANERYEHLKSVRAGADPGQLETQAQLETMLNPMSYAKADGSTDWDAHRSGIKTANQAIERSQGNPDQGLDVNPTRNAEAVKATSPFQEQVSNITKPASDIRNDAEEKINSQEGAIDSSTNTVKSDLDKKQAEGSADTASKAQNYAADLTSSAIQEGRQNIINSDDDLNNAAYMSGGLENTANWMDRQTSGVADGLEAYNTHNEHQSNIAKHMKEPEAELYKELIADQEQKMREDFGGVAGAIMVTSNDFVDAIRGGASDVSDWLGGVQRSEAWDNLSNTEKGAVLDIISTEAENQGWSAQESGLQNARENIAANSGLPQELQPMFASQFGGSDEDKAVAIEEFRDSFRDGDGNISKENNAYVDAVAYRIAAASDTGSLASAELTDIVGQQQLLKGLKTSQYQSPEEDKDKEKI